MTMLKVPTAVVIGAMIDARICWSPLLILSYPNGYPPHTSSPYVVRCGDCGSTINPMMLPSRQITRTATSNVVTIQSPTLGNLHNFSHIGSRTKSPLLGKLSHGSRQSAAYLRSKRSSGLPSGLGPANMFNRQVGG